VASQSANLFTDRILDALEKGTLRVVHKPWGHELIIETRAFLLKLIDVNADHQTSLQHHEVKDEVQWVLHAKGPGGIWVHSDTAQLKLYRAGDHVRVRPGTIHRTVGPCMLLEVTTLENDDVVRHEDDYGRTPQDDDGLTDDDLRGLMQ
jgi:mannose-6-phosphate isomerase-like protein (cupin superfamily)